jgi:hypothetical protein
MRNEFIDALVQNYGFERKNLGNMPSVDFVYPNFTADGNTESFRFSTDLRTELQARANIVYTELDGKELIWTPRYETLFEVAEIAPRLGIREQLTEAINSVYYEPFLFVGVGEKAGQKDIRAYVVKPIVDFNMAWFELTDEEQKKTIGLLEKMAQNKPYKTLMQRLFGGKR